MLEKAWPAWSSFYYWPTFYSISTWNLWLIQKTLTPPPLSMGWAVHRLFLSSVSSQSEERPGCQMAEPHSGLTWICQMLSVLCVSHCPPLLSHQGGHSWPCLFSLSSSFKIQLKKKDSVQICPHETKLSLSFQLNSLCTQSWDLVLYLICSLYHGKTPYSYHIFFY